MRRIIKSTMLALVVSCGTLAINAQTPYDTTGNADSPGSIDLAVQVAKSADLRKNGASANVGRYGAAIISSADNNALNTTITFHNVSPSLTSVSKSNDFSYGQIQLQARSNTGFEIKAFVDNTGTNGIPAGPGNQHGTAGSGIFELGDIGFGLSTQISPNNTALITGNKIIPVGNFSGYPTGATINNGQPKYKKTFNDLGTDSASAVTVANGGRISKGGDNTSNNNWQAIRMRIAIRPQYYAPTSNAKSAILKLFIITP